MTGNTWYTVAIVVTNVARWTGTFDDVIVDVTFRIRTARTVGAGTLAALVDASLVGWTVGIFAAADNESAQNSWITTVSGRTLADRPMFETVTFGIFTASLQRRCAHGDALPVDTGVRARAFVV